MNHTSQPPIVTVDTTNETPEHSFIIRKIDDAHYVIAESGQTIQLLDNGSIFVKVKLTNSTGQQPFATSDMQAESYQYKTNAGHWIEFRAENNKLKATYL